MKKIAAVSVFFLVFCGSLSYAQTSDVSLSAGYRSDKFDWNIAGDTGGHNPNILSELTWSNLRIYELRALYRRDFGKTQYLKGSFGYGWIHDGKNQDSDFSSDNRSGEFSRSNNGADAGSVWDLSVGVGFKNAMTPELAVNPVVGFSVDKQNLRLRDGFQTIASAGTPPVGPIANLNSKYDAAWYGPWAGLDAEYSAGRVVLTGALELHLARYLADANWNLRGDLAHPKSFEQTAWGGGVVAGAGARYSFTERWAITGDAMYQRWKTLHGNDRTFFSDGTAADTRLNEVNWSSYALFVGGRYSF